MIYLFLSFEIIFPILLFMAVGYFIKKTGMSNEQGFNAINRMVFHLFLPLKLFVDIVNSDFNSAFQIRLICFSLLGIALCLTALALIVPKFVKEPRNAPVVVQGIYRSNYILFGLSVAANIYPNRDIGVVSIISAFTVPFFNITTVVLFEFFKGDKPDMKKLALGVINNRFVQAALLSGIFLFFNLHIPGLLSKPLKDMASLSGTLALICLGASFSFSSLKKYGKILAACCVSKLVILPAIFIACGILIGYRDLELTAIMLLFGSPTAAASYTMAKELGGNDELAGMIIAVTSVGSIITMFLWIFALKYFQLI